MRELWYHMKSFLSHIRNLWYHMRSYKRVLGAFLWLMVPYGSSNIFWSVTFLVVKTFKSDLPNITVIDNLQWMARFSSSFQVFLLLYLIQLSLWHDKELPYNSKNTALRTRKHCFSKRECEGENFRFRTFKIMLHIFEKKLSLEAWCNSRLIFFFSSALRVLHNHRVARILLLQ